MPATKIDDPFVSEFFWELRREFDTYILLHCKTEPDRVIDVLINYADDELAKNGGLDFDEDVVRESAKLYLKSGSYWKPEMVAEALWKIRCEGETSLWSGAAPDIEDEEEEILSDAMQVEFEDDPANPFKGVDPSEELSAREVAAMLGRSYGYVKDHGKDLGGKKNAKGAWTFSPAEVAKVYEAHKPS